MSTILEHARESVISKFTTTDVLDAISECGITDITALLSGFKAGDRMLMGDAVMTMIDSYIDDLAADEVPNIEAAQRNEREEYEQERYEARREDARDRYSDRNEDARNSQCRISG